LAPCGRPEHARFGFERDLGLTRRDALLRLDAGWRIDEDQGLSLVAFRASRSRSAALR
jgi:hypothetical protein